MNEGIKMLKVEKISKTFSEKMILDDINIIVDTGSIYGLIGKNGAGKTTLMNIIAGLLTSDSNSFNLSSDIDKIGYLPDSPAFYDYLTAKEYMDFLLMNYRNKELEKYRDELLNKVGIPAKMKIRSMSRGMKQRLGVASALVNDPEIILLDEPTSALDPLGRFEFMKILNELKVSGKSILLSTHILADMEQVCDKVGFLHEGKIQKEIIVSDLVNGKCNAWKITFENDFPCEQFSNEYLKITKVDESTYVFESTNQRMMLDILRNISIQITHIENQRKTLDEYFQEVCK